MFLRVCRFSLLALISLPLWAIAQGEVQLIATNDVIRLSPQLKVFRETDNPLGLFDIKQRLGEFVWQHGDNPNYGFSDKGIWLHTTISNVTENKQWVIDVGFTQLEKVDIYVMLGDEVLGTTSHGKIRSNPRYRFPTLKLDLPYAQTIDLYVRIESQRTALLAPVDIQTEAHHERINFYDNLIWGLFYGGLIMLALYNLILYVGIRDNCLLAYVGYICSILIWQFVWGGHLHLLMPSAITTWASSHTDLIYIIIGIFSGLFTISFLEMSKSAPNSLVYIKICIGLLTTLGLLSILYILPPVWVGSLVYLTSIITIASCTYAGFESYGNQFYAARYFIFAWSILASFALIAILSLMTLLPSNFFTAYCFQFGVFIEAGLFSLAIMDKSRYQLEHEVEQTTDDLRNNIELVEEQNVRLDIARKDAIAASNVKSKFLANMSHEIRTPLNAILGFSRELHSDSLPPEKQEQVSIINAAADNLLSIVNDVLDFSKIEAGKLKINNHPFSPNEMLEDMVSVMAKSAHLKNLEFIYNLEPLPEKLIGDSYRIKQVLNNLLGNALKFTDHGFVSLSVYGKEREHGIYELVLKIEDSGIGISREDQRKLFAAFSQVEDALSRSYQGTGLGLVICQELVKLMRGELTLQSTPHSGSIFTVTIRSNLLNTNLSLSPDSEWLDKKIIYFDPFPQSRYCGVKILTYLGASVTGVESLAYLRELKQHYDLVFICVPNNKENILPNILEATRHLDADNAVLLYSGIESLSNRSDLSQYFSHQMRLPLTLGKLNSLLRAPEESPTDKLQQRLATLPSAKVLAVDDLEINLRLLTTWLKNTNLQLTLAFSGADAVSQCKDNEFDLILMDVQMPHMDGLEATKQIRQTDLNLGTPIIAVTAHAFKEEQDKLLASGMDDYLPKPINLSDLIDLIKRWCLIADPISEEQLSFDWSLALKRAHQNEDAAKDILQQFVQQLPQWVESIEQANQVEDYVEMQAKVHQLHGACCYTGVPAMLTLCSDMESALKLKQIELAKLRVSRLKSESLNLLLAVEQAKII
ncbi:hybrid sensor histidine kinase/response regulator [Paraglaciecola sp. MB-3u-78]|jgi:two-component system sensor histidine kinase BarA|uniref:hybrid sensor histidine kinase/response regulator n=1 Tax=Paraglaciecola sp. MB-3u-78 TaxID=2058332 RepID=UPI001E52A8B4|nr:hybrid sensor histidine kinase/response regulator [Paraglaciecola sp. MB-3u-78]